MLAEMDKLLHRRNTTLKQVVDVIAQHYSKAACLKKLNLGFSGANYKWLNLLIETHGVDVTHFTGQGHLRNKTHGWNKQIPLSEILVKDSTYLGTSRLKQRLYDDGLLVEICYRCLQGPSWNEQYLVLHLDHIDGDKTNNLIENLQILCPNCHSQTETYCGRNIGSGTQTGKAS